MDKKKRVLLVEDEPHLAFNIEFNLQAEGYDVVPAATGQVALEKFASSGPFDLIVLDIMIPQVNGIEVARKIRTSDKVTGILMLTAMSSSEDIIAGLEAGADDYMTKPFKLKEFLLRVKRMAERSALFASRVPSRVEGSLKRGGVELDMGGLRLTTRKGSFDVTVLEAKLLGELIKNAGKTLTREYLLEEVWGLSGHVETRTVDNFILRLRRYIEANPKKPLLLKSIRGMGYRLEEGTNADSI